ncbi:hypothetical protein ULF88_03080 [Halopseudomonas pachastrellae]|nr:hypothetical protein [Halopseudomonas pachastrellae]
MRIELELSPQEAHAMLEAARQQYRLRYQDEFWKARYSHLPHGLRHGSILAHCKDMAAKKNCWARWPLPLATTPSRHELPHELRLI